MIKNRAFKALNLKQFSFLNKIDRVKTISLNCPSEKQYVLRMLIKNLSGDIKIPNEYQWIKPLLDTAIAYQEKNGIYQPFIYLTIRNGLVESKTDDEWHVDGFSTRITHLPEQNYIWSNCYPTEYIIKRFFFHFDFDPLIHNINKYAQNRILNHEKFITLKANIEKMEENTLYALDPYIFHRRPDIPSDVKRCFIRISFTPIEINDINNTFNPLIPTQYNRDGIKDVRNLLIDYDEKNKH